MYASIQRLAQLPDETLICCAHEYTLSNLKFAHAILPADQDIATYQQQIEQLRSKNLPSLPVKLQFERKINVFYVAMTLIYKENRNNFASRLTCLCFLRITLPKRQLLSF